MRHLSDQDHGFLRDGHRRRCWQSICECLRRRVGLIDRPGGRLSSYLSQISTHNTISLPNRPRVSIIVASQPVPAVAPFGISVTVIGQIP